QVAMPVPNAVLRAWREGAIRPLRRRATLGRTYRGRTLAAARRALRAPAHAFRAFLSAGQAVIAAADILVRPARGAARARVTGEVQALALVAPTPVRLERDRRTWDVLWQDIAARDIVREAVVAAAALSRRRV